MRRVYLAAPYGARGRIREYAKKVEALELQITSSWLTEDHEINAGTQGAATSLPDEQVRDHALADFRDILDSDLLVLFTSKYLGVEGGGGRHVETGFALANRLPIIVVGNPENVFHRLGLPVVQLVPDESFALESIARRARDACVVCDCSEYRACAGGCHWVGDNVCSRCAA